MKIRLNNMNNITDCKIAVVKTIKYNIVVRKLTSIGKLSIKCVLNFHGLNLILRSVILGS